MLRDGDVVLEPVARSDAEDLIAGVRSSYRELAPWLPWASAGYDHEDADFFLAQVEAGHERAFAIRPHGQGPLVGLCGLNGIDETNRTANLGYWLRTDATGRGLATRAARLVLAHGLGTLEMERIEIVAAVTNPASVRVAQRLQLADEGVRARAVRLAERQHDARVFAAFPSDLDHLGV
jgi:ribosomal-protein-serine acetyltransferase